MVIALLEKAGLLLTLRNFGLVFAVALAASFAWESFPDLFSLYKAVQLFPFFLLGLGLYRFGAQLITQRNVTTMAVALAILVIIDQAYLFELVDLDETDMAVVGTALGLAAISLLIARRFYFKPLAWLGYFSFEIYLFHVFGTAGARIVLNKLQVHDVWVVFYRQHGHGPVPAGGAQAGAGTHQSAALPQRGLLWRQVPGQSGTRRRCRRKPPPRRPARTTRHKKPTPWRGFFIIWRISRR